MPVLDAGVVDSPFWTTLKRIEYPGGGPEHGFDYVKHWNTLVTDQLFPLTGLADNPHFYIREDGYYNIYATWRQPPGFGVGWTGTGQGGGSIATSRYGWEATYAWGPVDMSTGDKVVTLGPIKRYLLVGDWIAFISQGEGTGAGVRDYDSIAIITRLRS
jgi:hypothetical protein